jgi:hypothetical protein
VTVAGVFPECAGLERASATRRSLPPRTSTPNIEAWRVSCFASVSILCKHQAGALQASRWPYYGRCLRRRRSLHNSRVEHPLSAKRLGSAAQVLHRPPPPRPSRRSDVGSETRTALALPNLNRQAARFGARSEAFRLTCGTTSKGRCACECEGGRLRRKAGAAGERERGRMRDTSLPAAAFATPAARDAPTRERHQTRPRSSLAAAVLLHARMGAADRNLVASPPEANVPVLPAKPSQHER